MTCIPEARRKTEDEKALTRFAEESKPLGSLDAGSNQCDEAAQRASSIVAAPARESVSASDHFCRLDELQRRCAAPAWKPDPEKNVFCNEASFTACIEQFRTLRSRLYRLREKQSFRIVLVTSTLPGEGKTFVALNLAQAIARQHERRALLIDADLRASRLHVRMGAPSAPGLSDYLAGEADEFSIVQADAKEDIFFIPAGRSVSNPAELLANNRLKSLLGRMAPVFEWIIVDAPPVLPVSDASMLARICDGVIFVLRAGTTSLDLAQTACQELRENNLLGAVLNGADEDVMYGAYSYYAGNGLDKR